MVLVTKQMEAGHLNFGTKPNSTKILSKKPDCSLEDFDGNFESDAEVDPQVSTDGSTTVGSKDLSCDEVKPRNKAGMHRFKQSEKRRSSMMDMDPATVLRKKGQADRADALRCNRLDPLELVKENSVRRSSIISNGSDGSDGSKNTFFGHAGSLGSLNSSLMKDMFRKKDVSDDPAAREIAILRKKGQHTKAHRMEQLRKQFDE